MRRVDYREYLEYARSRGVVRVEGVEIRLDPVRVERLHPTPEELTGVDTTVWSFPRRGSWATHRGDYRGNWPPQLARALILMYTRPGDTVLDPMVGSGTTCVEAMLLGRNCVGIDISYDAVMLTLHRLYWLRRHLEELSGGWEGEVPLDEVLRARVEVYHGDARSLEEIGDDSIDLVATHPPYYNIIRYTRHRSPGDLSASRRLEDYLRSIYTVALEAYRVLKPGGHMGILVGDTRIRRHYVPITHHVLEVLLRAGFTLREEVVKIQHRMKTTRERWARAKRDFLLIYHEKLYILRKPAEGEGARYKYSRYLDLDEVLDG